MGGGRPYPPLLGSRDPYAVTFDSPDDAGFPQNFPFGRRWCTVWGHYLPLSVSLGSAMFSQASPEIMAIYHIGVTPAALTTALFVFGFASGPVIYGPLSGVWTKNHYGDFSFICVLFICCCHSQRYSNNYDMSVFSLGLLGQQRLLFLQLFFRFVSDRAKGYRYFDICWGAFGGPMLAPIFGGFTVKTLVWAGDGQLILWYGCLLGVGVERVLLDETHHNNPCQTC